MNVRMMEAESDIAMTGMNSVDAGEGAATHATHPHGLKSLEASNGSGLVGDSGPHATSQHDHLANLPKDALTETEFLNEINCPRERKGLMKSGLCYDDRMKLHSDSNFDLDYKHPEDPARVESIMAILKKAGLVFTGRDKDLPAAMAAQPGKYMWRIPARKAHRQEICLAHTEEHFEWVEGLSTWSPAKLREKTVELDKTNQSLYVSSTTYESALLSAGGAIDTCRAILGGEVKNAFAVIRPPGHHAESDEAMGFCFFNNVPVAVKVCQREFPTCRKVLIVDWDVHHGNGIQEIFYDDPNVLYISLHVYLNGQFYPCTEEGGWDKCGQGLGEGKNVNIGWNEKGKGDGDYMAAFQKIVMPIAHEFDPDLVIISAGFDAAEGDPLGQCHVSPACYGHMTHMLMSLANGRLAVCLEGGYDLEAISNSALAVARTLMGEPPPKFETLPLSISKDGQKVLDTVRAYQANYWECMRPGLLGFPSQKIEGPVPMRLQEVVRIAQTKMLTDSFDMIPMYLTRPNLSRAFENQVMVTGQIHYAPAILVIIHDPPELQPHPDPTSGHFDLRSAWMVDGVSRYISWAVERMFGAMDINIPLYDPGKPPGDDGWDAEEKSQYIEELVCYVWDNYLSLFDNTPRVILMGTGHAMQGVKLLLTKRYARTGISGVINFLDDQSLRPVKASEDPELSPWYKDNSLVYITREHDAWQNPELQTKIQKKRYGNIIKSDAKGLNQMMDLHFADVVKWIQQQLGLPEPTEDDSRSA